MGTLSQIQKHMGYHTRFKKLNESTVIPVVDYGSEIWGGKSYPTCKCDNVQNRAIHLFLGVDKFSLLPTLQGDMPFYALQGFILFQGRGGVKSRSKEIVDNVGTIQLETLSPI